MSKIEIDPERPDIFSWAEKRKEALEEASTQYVLAAATGEDKHKVRFFDAHHRARQIEQAVNDYFAGGSPPC